jgi:alanine racemase
VVTDSSAANATDRAWVDVDLAALARNARHISAASGARLLPMVKANGYGLGAVAVAQALEPLEPWGYGVATLEEGAELRRAGIARRIVLFTPAMPGWFAALRREGVTPVLGDPAALGAWLAQSPVPPFHLGIDTGMSRAGLGCDDAAALAATRALVEGAAGYEGACTHFHSAELDTAATDAQWSRLEQAIAAIGVRPPLVHAANSAAALRGRHHAGDLVRPGIFLYGGRVGADIPATVAALRGRVVSVRRLGRGASVSYGATWRAAAPATIATVAAGYADGVLRALGNSGAAELNGRRVPIRGTVTMDMTMLETGEDARIGDVATLYGGLVTLDEQAEAAGTVSYELLTALGTRLERRYGAGATDR